MAAESGGAILPRKGSVTEVCDARKHLIKALDRVSLSRGIRGHGKGGGCSLPVPRRKIGHIRADYDGWRWYNTVWPCHKSLATPEVCTEIDRVYDALTAPSALKDLVALRKFCADHMDACISKEYEDEFSFYYVGERCNFWIRLITRKGDYNMYLNAYTKENDNQKYFVYLERLRQSGETNMYGAAPYLQVEFPELRYDRNKAGEILLAWIRTFNEKEDDTPC